MTKFDKLKTTIFGKRNEGKFLYYLKNKDKNFIKNLKPDGTDFQPIDFINKQEKQVVEFKSRTFKHDKYDTTIINWCKVLNYINVYRPYKYKFWIYFLYTDGLYRIRYSKKLHDTLSSPRFIYPYQECRSSGKVKVIDIPINKLEFVSTIEDYGKKLKKN